MDREVEFNGGRKGGRERQAGRQAGRQREVRNGEYATVNIC